jgi:hypothetical protein
MKVGDLIKIKEFYKDGGREAIVLGHGTSRLRQVFFRIRFFDNGQIKYTTPRSVEIISEAS